jgi:ppGpp synthetase/RelA/SpoT-type nucleotidyltranferase
MKKIKRYGMGGAVQSFSSPMLAQGMQGSLSGFGTSGLGTFANGGQVKIVKRDEGNFWYKRTEGAIGSFQWKYDDRYPEGILFPLDEFDTKFYQAVKLKKGEVLFRYETDVMVGGMRPLIKLNLDKSLIYFGVDSDIASDEDEPKFESRGVKAEYIVLEEGYDKKFAKGGKMNDEHYIVQVYTNGKVGADSMLPNVEPKPFADINDAMRFSKSLMDENFSEIDKITILTSNGRLVQKYTNSDSDKNVKEKRLYKQKIPNNYQGKTAEQVWNLLTPAQRSHYLSDHENGDYKNLIHSDWNELNDRVRNGFEMHVQEGQYAKGGEVEELQVGDIVTHKKGREYGHGRIYKTSSIGIYLEDKFGNKREQPFYFPSDFKKVKKMFADGGEAEVHIENADVNFDEKHYKGLLSDFDLDGLPNVDDPDPFGNQDKKSIEQVKFSKTFKKVLDTKQDLDGELKKFVSKLQNSTSSDEKIYARSKTPFSILNKLVDSRLLDEKRGLKDLVGTTITFKNTEDLKKYMKKVRRGDLGKVIDFDDYYANPNDGYRAYHFIIEQDGIPIELQLKTDRMKEVNILSHDAYKNKSLNKEYMLYLTSLANEADNGNGFSKEQFNMIMRNKAEVRKMLNSKNN